MTKTSNVKRIDFRSHEYNAPYGAGDANSRRPNSRKAYVQRLFDSDGFEAAERWGLKHGLKATTLRTWANSWRRAMNKAKASKARKAKRANAKPAAAEAKAA